MKTKQVFMILAISLTATLGFAATSSITATASKNREKTLDIYIQGAAAKQISAQLSKNGVTMKRDRFSGALVQKGKGVRCIDKQADLPLYCYMALVGSAIE